MFQFIPIVMTTTEKEYQYDENMILKPVVIEDNVWIGMNVSVVPGITIGQGAIVGMGSVVVKDVPPKSIVGGNPARVIGERNHQHYEEKLKHNKIGSISGFEL